MAKYRLQTALNVRARMEKIRQKEFAIEVQRVQHIKNRIEELGTQIEDSRQAADTMKREGLTIAGLQFHEHFRSRVARQRKQMEGQLRQQEEVAKRRQKHLVQATQKRKVMEILKERFVENEKKEADRRERIEMDEIAQNFYLKGR